MRTTFRKSVSDLRERPARTALVLFGLVIGLWGVGSILVSYAVLRKDLSENFVRTKPAHAVLTSKDFDRLDMPRFLRRFDLEGAEFRDLSIQRIEVKPDRWIPVWVFGVEDFEKLTVARFSREEGARVPKPGTMLIERNGQLISNLRAGSTAVIRAGANVMQIPISGISFDPAQAPATQDAFIYAYVDKATYRQITGEAPNQQLLIRFKTARSKSDVDEQMKPILEDFKTSAIVIDTFRVPEFNEHPHQWQLNSLLGLQGIIGLSAFLVGAVLVSQLMAATLSQQIRQIGMMKAIGATRLQVLTIYIMMVLLYGIVASAIAIPLAVGSGYAFSGFVARVLNFEILTTTLPVFVYVVLLGAGLSLPLLLSLPTLIAGTRISVREALADYGLTGVNVVGKSRAPVRLPVSGTFLLAFRNTMRRKRRMLVTAATMALGVAVFNTGFNVRQALIVFLEETRASLRYDVQVVLNDSISEGEALKPFGSIRNLARIETWNGGRGRLQTRSISMTNGIGIIALPRDTRLLKPELVSGHWLKQSQDIEVVMNQKAAEAFGNPAVGGMHTISVKGTPIQARLVGIVKEMDVAKAYIDKDQYDVLVNPRHWINSVMFIAQDRSPDKVIQMQREVEAAIAPSRLSVLYVMSQAERVKIIYDHLNIILTVITLLALLVLVVSAIGMASATGINILERKREIGILRAIGATPRQIYRLFTTEGMILSVLSIALGLAFSWPLSIAASTYFGTLIIGPGAPLHAAFSASGFGITIGMTLVFGWLSSRLPAQSAVALSTREALAYE